MTEISRSDVVGPPRILEQETWIPAERRVRRSRARLREPRPGVAMPSEPDGLHVFLSAVDRCSSVFIGGFQAFVFETEHICVHPWLMLLPVFSNYEGADAAADEE